MGLRPETVAVMTPLVQAPLPELANCSSWLILIRATAWMRQFADRARKEPVAEAKELTVQELDFVELMWARRAENESFGAEIAVLRNGKPLLRTSRLKDLTLVIDNIILKINGRWQTQQRSSCPGRHEATNHLGQPTRIHDEAPLPSSYSCYYFTVSESMNGCRVETHYKNGPM